MSTSPAQNQNQSNHALSVSYNSLVKRRRVVIFYSTLFNTSSNLIFFGGGEGFCNGVPNQIVPTVYSSDEENPTASANRSSKFTAPFIVHIIYTNES